jgi:hypothetical protein
VFPATVPVDLVTHMHMLVNHKCVLVVAKEQLFPLLLKPVFKLGLWGCVVCKEQAYKVLELGEFKWDKVCICS